MNEFRSTATKLFFFMFLPCVLIMLIIVRQTDTKIGFKHVKQSGNIVPENRLAKTFLLKSRNESETRDFETHSKRWVVLFWSTIFGRSLTAQDEVEWKKGDCPVACELTVNHSRSGEADAFVVHARDAHMIPPTHAAPWILLTQENPVYTPVLSDPGFMSKFNLLTSYRLDFDFPNPTFGIPDLKVPVPFSEKTGMIFAAFSNCEPVRIEYMRQLMTFVQVDSYGGCLRNKHELVDRYGKDFKELKTELARKYKFTLVFFNQDCDYFVDEQLTHALSAGSVPVVMGTDKLDEFLPGNLRNSAIRVRDFKSPHHLADYLKYLSSNETEYNQFLDWKWKGFGNISGTAIGYFWKPDYPIYCQICVALSEGRIHKDGLETMPCKPRAYEDWGIIPSA